jgi:hypothetical protein
MVDDHFVASVLLSKFCIPRTETIHGGEVNDDVLFEMRRRKNVMMIHSSFPPLSIARRRLAYRHTTLYFFV